MALHQFLLEAEANARDTGKVGAVDTILPGAKKQEILNSRGRIIIRR